MNDIYIRDSFLESYDDLPEMYRAGVRETLAEFRAGRLMKSRHPEKLPAYAGLYTLRVDRRYRIIMNKIAGAAYVLLLVGPHDVIYDWADKNKKKIGGMSEDPADYTALEEAMPDLFSAGEAPAETSEAEVPVSRKDGRFARFRDRELMKGLVSEAELAAVRNCVSDADFEGLKELLSPSSMQYIRHLEDGMSVGEALHELYMLRQSREEHEAFEREMEKIRNDFRKTYDRSRFPNISGEDRKYNMLAGAAGTGKTTELIYTIRDAVDTAAPRDRVLFLVSNPDWLADMRSYIRIVTEPELLERVDILDYAGLMDHILRDVGGRWKLDFRVGELNDDEDLLSLFTDAAEQDEELGLEVWDLMHDWEYVVENYGVFTEKDYLAAPRIGCCVLTDEEKLKVWKVFERFIAQMEQEKFYTVGYAIWKLLPMVKRRCYKPYGLILADDVHFLNYSRIDFLTALRKSPLSLYTADVRQESYIPWMIDLLNPKCCDGNLFLGAANTRLDKRKMTFMGFENLFRQTACDRDGCGVELIPVSGCDPEEDADLADKLCALVKRLGNLKNSALIVPNMDYAEIYRSFFSENGIPSVIVDNSQSYFDYLLEDGIRICTFLRAGCLTFDNVIIPDSRFELLDDDPGEGIVFPDRYWYFDWSERLWYQNMLFGRGVAASRNMTYIFTPQNEESLVRLYEENVN